MHDIIIIGAGVIGSSIARELSKYHLNICVLEKGADVASGSSKANSGIVHAGYDAKPGSKKAKFNMAGQKMFDKVSAELKFPFNGCGSLVVAFNEKDLDSLYDLKERGEANGLTDLEVIGKSRLKELEPHISDNVFAALSVPSGGIVCPYEMTIAYAENAAENGVKFLFNTKVTDIKNKEGYFIVKTTDNSAFSNEELHAKIIINASGLFSDEINNMVSKNKIKISARRGEYCLFDKTEDSLVNHTIFQLPTEMGKGILVTPTVDGNLLLGPTSVEIEDKNDVSTSALGLKEVLEKVAWDIDALPVGKTITSFAGLRAHASTGDFIIGEAEDVSGFINVAGIESPGLSSAPAIAVYVEGIAAKLVDAKVKDNYNPIRIEPVRLRHMTDEQRDELIKRNPEYGKIICRCETVSKGEILDALRSPLGVKNLDAIKRRTRAGMGRCQSGFCNMRLLDIVSEECNIPITQVTKFGGSTNVLLEENKESFKREGAVCER